MPAGTIAERVTKAHGISLKEITMRSTGLGAGVGNCLGMIVDPPGQILGIAAFSKAMTMALSERDRLRPGGPL